jgi:NAD(P)-dependent dehydrogenase (short-subunit alcohol dehydrogenase family)
MKRALRYIIKGVPNVTITANVKVNHSGNTLLGKHILITGGSQGIGFSIAKKCVNEGAVVLICGRNTSRLLQAQKELGGEQYCKAISFDISDVENTERFLLDCYDKSNDHIDCLVNNAGVSLHEEDFSHVTIDGFDKQFNTNFKGSYFLTKHYLEQQKKRNSIQNTNILFISSERGSFHTDIPYGLTKAMINSLVGGLNNRLAAEGLRVNALAPGVTVSEMTGRGIDDLTYKGNPCGRVFLPEEMAEVAVFLLSDYSKCISGEVVHCDYGAHLKCI